MAADAPDVSDEVDALDKLIAAVVQVKITEPAATAKQVHEILLQDAAWADVAFSLVKKACSKAAKLGATSQANAAPAPAPAAPASPGHVVPMFPLGEIRAGSILLSGRGPPIASATTKKPEASERSIKKIAGGRYKDAGEGMAKVSKPKGKQQAGTVLTLGHPADFTFLKKLEKKHLAGVAWNSVGGPANDEMATAVRAALEEQPAWKDAPPLVKALQPIFVALFLERPRWLSREGLQLAEQLGFVAAHEDETGDADGELSLSAMVEHPHLFPLLKAALEPCDDVRANYELGLRWLRAQQVDPDRPRSLMSTLLLEAVHATYLEEGPPRLSLLAERICAIQDDRSGFSVVENPTAPRDGIDGMLVDIMIAGERSEELSTSNAFVPLLVMGAHLKKEAERGNDPTSEEALRSNGLM